MKKVLLLIIISFSYICLEALPMGAPSMPQVIEEGFFISSASWINFRLGYEGNFVFNRKLKKKFDNLKRVDNFAIDTQGATCTLNFENRLDLYGVVGEARVQSNWRIEPILGMFGRVEMETKYDLAWAAGIKAILLEWGNTLLSTGGRYSSFSSFPLWLALDGTLMSPNGSKIKFYEWQVDLGVSHNIKIFTPYIGVKYSKVYARLPTFIADEMEKVRAKNRKPLGMVIGSTLSNSKIFALNIEMRLIDEEGATISGDLKF